MRREWLIPGGLLILVFLVFLPTLHYSLVYDDLGQITQNPRLTAWSYVPGYFGTHLWAHLSEPPTYYRPIFLLWLRLTYALLGPPGAMWHLGSIVAHLGATVSVFLLLRQLTGEFVGAALAAGLFALHPVQTEAVAWVSSVSEPLLTIFVVLSMYFYLSRKGPVSVLSLLFAVLAMLTKETGIVIPALILTYEWIHSDLKNAVAGSAPYLLPALLSAALRSNAMGLFAFGRPAGMSFGEMILTWPKVLAAYGAHLLWPVHLSACYDVYKETAAWPLLLLIIGIATLFWVMRRWPQNIRLGAVWFTITLVPSLALRYLPPGDFVHDRYLYLPFVGLALIAAVGFSQITFTPIRLVAASAFALILCVGTESNLHIWHDNVSLFRRAVETAPKNPCAKNDLALSYLQEGRADEAVPLLEQAVELSPNYWEAYRNLGLHYQLAGNSAKAERYFNLSDQAYRNVRGVR